jgi:hypothetical protein
VLELKRLWQGGARHLVFEPLDLLAGLAPLTPRPRLNLFSYHGVLAPNARWRAAVGTFGTLERSLRRPPWARAASPGKML